MSNRLIMLGFGAYPFFGWLKRAFTKNAIYQRTVR